MSEESSTDGIFFFGELWGDCSSGASAQEREDAVYRGIPQQERAVPAKLQNAMLFSSRGIPMIVLGENAESDATLSGDEVRGTFLQFAPTTEGITPEKTTARAQVSQRKTMLERIDQLRKYGCSEVQGQLRTGKVVQDDGRIFTASVVASSSGYDTIEFFSADAALGAIDNGSTLSSQATKESTTTSSYDVVFHRTARRFGIRIHEGDWAGKLFEPFVPQSVREGIAVRHVFAYGTLRPDDTSGAPWTLPFNEGMKSTRGKVRGMQMFFAAYPFACPTGAVPPKLRKENHADFVIGFAVTCDDDGLWQQKMEQADSIEGFPSLYQRAVVPVELDSGETVLSYVYYRLYLEVALASAAYAAGHSVGADDEDDADFGIKTILDGDFCRWRERETQR